MVDSVALFPLGYRFEDAQGVPYSGATVEFYDAGTTSPKTVFADKDLTVELGTSITTDSAGRPTSDGTTPTDIFVGTADYKFVLKDADGNTIETKDNRPGAVQSASPTDVSVTASFPVVTKSLAYSVVADDQNSLFKVNCSSADVTLTLPSAVTVGNGWAIRIQHAGSANQAILATVSSQTISEGSKSFSTQYVLALNGEDIELRSDGGNWVVVSHTVPFIKVAQGIIPITDRLSSPPGSPQHGALYLLTSSPSGAWSTFAQHDIVQYTGGSTAWVKFTPYTDCGWLAFVADENIYYRFVDSAWVAESATVSFAGTIKLADQSAQETGTSATQAVLPSVQQFHPSAAKFVMEATVSGGTPTLKTPPAYNITSITDSGQGDLTVTIATDFSSAFWAALLTTEGSGNRLSQGVTNAKAAGTYEARCADAGGTPQDPEAWNLVGFGDQ